MGIITRLSGIFALPLLVACPAPALPPTTLTVTIQANTDGLPADLSLSHVFFSLSKVQVVSDADVGGLPIPGEAVIDVLDKDAVFPLTDAPPALYSRVRFGLAGLKKDGVVLPPEFDDADLSLLILGSVTLSDGQTVPLEYRDQHPFNLIDLPLAQGLDLAPGAAGTLQVTASLGVLLADVDLSSISSGDLTNGVLLIDADDRPFLNQHPALKAVVDLIQGNLPTVFQADEDIQ
jgi:hypothetical protein